MAATSALRREPGRRGLRIGAIAAYKSALAPRTHAFEQCSELWHGWLAMYSFLNAASCTPLG